MLLWSVMMLCLGLGNSLSAVPPQADDSQTQVQKARSEAASKKRRVIFNCDGGRLWMDGTGTVEGFLAPRLKPLVGTHVDTIFLDVVGGDAPLYDSHVQPVYGVAQGRDALPNLKSLIDAGYCPLHIVTDFAHHNGMEAFASIRMNDVHDSFIDGHISVWKKQHPEMLVDKRESLPRMKLYVTALDFTHQTVRDRKFEIIEEVCERYDVDGIELDYLRHPVLFSRTMRGLPVTEGERRIMTTFTRRIRQYLDKVAARRGRPVLLAVRMPDTFELAESVGLDVRRWLEEGLIDLLIGGGGYAPFTLPVAELAKVSHHYGVPYFPCINQGVARDISHGSFLETVRALASNWQQAGADGVYTFNLFVPFDDKYGDELKSTRQDVYACLYEIGDPKKLSHTNKQFCLDANVFIYYTFVTVSPSIPAKLKHDEIRRLSIFVGDDVEAATQAGTLVEIQLQLILEGLVGENTISVKLNGQPLPGGDLSTLDSEKSRHRMNIPITTPPLRMGKNVIEASIRASNKQRGKDVVVDDVRLWVKYND